MNHEYHKYEFDGYNIHTIKSDRFKKCRIEVKFTSRVDEKDITQRNFVSALLMESTKRYPSSRLMNIHEEELYDIYVASDVNKYGEYLVMNYLTIFVNPKYTEDNMLQQSIEYLCETIFNPDIKDGKFNKKSFDKVMNKGKQYFKTVDDRPESRAQRKLLSIIGKGTTLNVLTLGDKKYLKTITPTNIVDIYNKHIYGDRCDIFIYGDIDMEKTMSIIHDNFKNNNKKNLELGNYLINIPEAKKVKDIVLYDKITQSAYVEGYLVKELNKYERCYVMPIFSALFGYGQESKLFRTVREKHSMCYSIGGSYNDTASVLYVRTKIDSKNVKNCHKLIKQCLEEMITGDFSEEELEDIKKERINDIEYIDESQKSTISFYYEVDLLGDDSREDIAKNYAKVTKEEIMNVAKKIHLHTTVLVRDEVKNENTSN